MAQNPNQNAEAEAKAKQEAEAKAAAEAEAKAKGKSVDMGKLKAKYGDDVKVLSEGKTTLVIEFTEVTTTDGVKRPASVVRKVARP